MNSKILKYKEGQWFAVPLAGGGYALGLIARGNYRTKVGLGYFFGPRYKNIPGNDETLVKKASEAVLITRFGDLGLISGKWPMISSTRSFSRSEWPIPVFGSEISLLPGKAFLREYIADQDGNLNLSKETVVTIHEIHGKPNDVMMGGGVVETILDNMILSPKF